MTFTEQRVTEGAQASKTQFCFDRATGFLERQRVLARTSPGSNDLLTVFKSETIGARETGQVARELLYGGDSGHLSTNNNLCGMNLPTGSYEQQHTYENGALATSAWIDCDGTEIVKTVDQDIDAKSGLVTQSRDSAGVGTTFVYDTMGRLTSERAQSGAWTQTSYQLPTVSSPNQPLQITVTQCGNGQITCGFNQRLAWQQSVYDGLGRMVEEHVQMPDIAPGSVKTSSRQHVYNELGWKLSETSWDSPGQKTRFENHDRFGRVGTVRPPGANPATDFTYHGERATTRRVWVQTHINGTRSPSYSTEINDTFGRLVGVCENRSTAWTGNCAGGQQTYYAYDEGDRLTQVCQNWNGSSCGQQRLFTYDNRGFLLSEKHPEIGPFGNGWTHFSYDARGNVRTRKIPGTADFDLAYRYNRASRLVRIDEVLTPNSSRPLKEFYFARSNTGSNRKAGKLVLAKRTNYVDILPPLPARRTGSIPVVISDAYEYKGRDGRASRHQLRYQLGVTAYLFNTAYTWDEQRNIDRLTYPNCLHDACASRVAPREVEHDYERGFLRKVGTYADFIAYQAGGMLRRVPHANGVSDWIDLAGDGLARPHRIRTERVSDGNWNTSNYIYDGAQNITNIGSLNFSYDLLSRLTVGDVDLGNGQIRRQSAIYDAYGNIQQLVSNGVAQNPAPNAATNPFGTEATDPGQDAFSLKFTGHERDENGGDVAGQLDYMMARYCSPTLGRFLTVDPVLGQAEVPQSWNRYAYVHNNPTKFVDPDGEAAFLAGALIGAVEGAAFQVVINKINGQPLLSGVGKEALTGAALGATGVGLLRVADKGFDLIRAAKLAKVTRTRPLHSAQGGDGLRTLADGELRAVSGGSRARVLQTGGIVLRPNTARALNRSSGLNLHKREWGRALEALKKPMRYPVISTAKFLIMEIWSMMQEM